MCLLFNMQMSMTVKEFYEVLKHVLLKLIIKVQRHIISIHAKFYSFKYAWKKYIKNNERGNEVILKN